MQLVEADLTAIERELCRRSLAEFAKRAWHVLEPAAELKWGWVLDAICEHLEAVTKGEINRLLINVPPGSMKSLLTGVIWPAWEWGPRNLAEMRFVSTAHEEQLAIRDSRRCRDLIKSDWFQNLWPLELAADLDGKREFGNIRKGIRQARAFTSMTGVRGDRVILDDPISADNANSAAKLEAVLVATDLIPETGIPIQIDSLGGLGDSRVSNRTSLQGRAGRQGDGYAGDEDQGEEAFAGHVGQTAKLVWRSVQATARNWLVGSSWCPAQSPVRFDHPLELWAGVRPST
jgi:hypothetical protein